MAIESVQGSRIDTPQRPEPQLVIVGGHPRSGTTVLRSLLNTHPDIMITLEFRNFMRLGSHPLRYLGGIQWRQWRRNLLQLTTKAPPRGRSIDNVAFMLAYALGILFRCRGAVTLSGIRSTLHSILPWARVVGDKYPDYVFKLDRLAPRPDLRSIVIYRDCRDVASSAVEMAQTAWKGKPFAQSMDTPSKVAARWVCAMDQLERNASNVHAVCYEELVTNTEAVIDQLGGFLAVDPGAFRQNILSPTNIGKYRARLSSADLDAIEAVAGPTMRQLGYG